MKYPNIILTALQKPSFCLLGNILSIIFIKLRTYTTIYREYIPDILLLGHSPMYHVCIYHTLAPQYSVDTYRHLLMGHRLVQEFYTVDILQTQFFIKLIIN